MPTAPQKTRIIASGDGELIHMLVGGRLLSDDEVEGAGGEEEHQDADQEAEVAKASRHEGLERRGRRIRQVGIRPASACAIEPEADQQVGREAHQLPADEEHQEVGAEHQDQHREVKSESSMKKRE